MSFCTTATCCRTEATPLGKPTARPTASAPAHAPIAMPFSSVRRLARFASSARGVPARRASTRAATARSTLSRNDATTASLYSGPSSRCAAAAARLPLAAGTRSRRYLESGSGCLRCKRRGFRASARTRYLECVFAVAAVSTGVSSYGAGHPSVCSTICAVSVSSSLISSRRRLVLSNRGRYRSSCAGLSVRVTVLAPALRIHVG